MLCQQEFHQVHCSHQQEAAHHNLAVPCSLEGTQGSLPDNPFCRANITDTLPYTGTARQDADAMSRSSGSLS